MEIKQLEVFVSVARTLNFSKSADELFISQPSVSAYIGSLEKHVGVQLFIRNAKGVILTKAGSELLTYAHNILTLRKEAVESISGIDRYMKGFIDVISSTIPAQYLLPDIIASFSRLWPNIVFRIEQADSHNVEVSMRGFRYDFGMVGAQPDSARFLSIPIYKDEFVLILPNNASFPTEATAESFGSFIMESQFIMRESGSGTRSEIEKLLTNIGVRLAEMKIPAYFSDATGIIHAVINGMGVSLVSKVAAGMYADAGKLKMVEIKDPLFKRDIFLLANKEVRLTPIQQVFFDHVEQYYSFA